MVWWRTRDLSLLFNIFMVQFLKWLSLLLYLCSLKMTSSFMVFSIHMKLNVEIWIMSETVRAFFRVKFWQIINIELPFPNEAASFNWTFQSFSQIWIQNAVIEKSKTKRSFWQRRKNSSNISSNSELNCFMLLIILPIRLFL